MKKLYRVSGIIILTGVFFIPAPLQAQEKPASLKRAALLRARIHIETQNWKEAKVELLSLQKKYPRDADVIYNLANVHSHLNESKKAENLYRTLVRDYPDNYSYASDLAYFLFEHAEYDKTVKFIESHWKSPDRMRKDILLLLAEAYDKSGNPEKTGELYDILVKQHPNDIPTLITIGDFYINTDKPARALKYLLRVEKIDPKNYRALKTIALAYNTVDPGKYVEYLEKAYPLDHGDYEAAFLLGEYYHPYSEKKALTYYTVAMSRLSKYQKPSTDQLRARARMLYRTGKVKAAENLYLSLIKSNPRILQLKNDYAEMLTDLKRYREAMKVLKPYQNKL